MERSSGPPNYDLALAAAAAAFHDPQDVLQIPDGSSESSSLLLDSLTSASHYGSIGPAIFHPNSPSANALNLAFDGLSLRSASPQQSPRVSSPGPRRTIVKSACNSRGSSPHPGSAIAVGTAGLASDDALSKIKPSTFPVLELRIGNFNIETQYKGDVVAKFYYSRKQIIWEQLNDGLKRKIEIFFKTITGLALLDAPSGNPKEAMLVIEVNQPPRFFSEINPQPKKNTLWTSCEDFTGGQALTHSRHCIVARRAFLRRHCEKLKQTHPDFVGLFQKGVLAEAKPLSVDESQYYGNCPQVQVDLNPTVLRAARISGIDLDSPYFETGATTPNSSLSACSDNESPRFQPNRTFDFDPSLIDATQTAIGRTQSYYSNNPRQGSLNLSIQGSASPASFSNNHFQSPVQSPHQGSFWTNNNNFNPQTSTNHPLAGSSSTSSSSSSPMMRMNKPTFSPSSGMISAPSEEVQLGNISHVFKSKNPSIQRVICDSHFDSLSFQKGYHSS